MPEQALTGERSDVGQSFVKPLWVVIFAVVLVGLALVGFVVLLQLWPGDVSTSTPGSSPQTRALLGFTIRMSLDVNLLMLAAVSGFLGGVVHSLMSTATYVGNRLLRWSWILTYFFFPIVGGILALVLIVLLRAGLVTGSSSGINAFGTAGVAALVGLFSDQALALLKKVFELVFAKPDPSHDSATSSGS